LRNDRKGQRVTTTLLATDEHRASRVEGVVVVSLGRASGPRVRSGSTRRRAEGGSHGQTPLFRHTQFSGVNNTVAFASLTDPTVTNLPYDESGNLVRYNGFETVNGVRLPRTIQLVTRLTF
jgi:hypothetical protein